MQKLLKVKEPLLLENGQRLSSLQIAYHTYGSLSEQKDNVIWICHALTANSDAIDWWEGLVGEVKLFDPKKYFIVCANILASPYGTTNPLSEDEHGNIYYLDFPQVTIRDMVSTHIILRKHLGINHIHTVLGGSIGSFQAIEWAIMEQQVVKNLIVIAGSAKASPWVVAFNEAQRMALRADKSFYEKTKEGGIEGLKAARAIALLSYRNQLVYNKTQSIENEENFLKLKAISYQQYQGDKLAKRFNAYSYYYISQSVDSHNVGRGRGSLQQALESIEAKTLIIGIQSDILFPKEDQYIMRDWIKGAKLEMIESIYGHDGFLLENEQIEQVINAFYETIH